MKVRIDDKDIYFDETRLMNYLRSNIDKGLDQEIKLPNGPTIDLRKHSIITVALRQIFSLFIPFLVWMAAQLGLQLPKKEKHGDVIKYTLDAYFLILATMARESILELETKPYIDETSIIVHANLDKESHDSDVPVPFLSMFKK